MDDQIDFCVPDPNPAGTKQRIKSISGDDPRNRPLPGSLDVETHTVIGNSSPAELVGFIDCGDIGKKKFKKNSEESPVKPETRR